MIGATTTPIPNTAIAEPRFSGGKLSRRTDCAMGCKAPPPAPCSMRANINMPKLVAAPHNAEDSVKITMQTIKNLFRPK